jgi:hypothetical protein
VNPLYIPITPFGLDANATATDAAPEGTSVPGVAGETVAPGAPAVTPAPGAPATSAPGTSPASHATMLAAKGGSVSLLVVALIML